MRILKIWCNTKYFILVIWHWLERGNQNYLYNYTSFVFSFPWLSFLYIDNWFDACQAAIALFSLNILCLRLLITCFELIYGNI